MELHPRDRAAGDPAACLLCEMLWMVGARLSSGLHLRSRPPPRFGRALAAARYLAAGLIAAGALSGCADNGW